MTWEGCDWNSGTEEHVEKEQIPGNCLIFRGHLILIQVKRIPITWSVSYSYLSLISRTACTMVPRYHLYPPKPILQTGDDVHLCPQPPVASKLTGNKSSLWSLLETRAFLGCHSLDGSYDPATLASAILEPSSPFLSAPGPCLYPNVPVERIHLHERTLLMNCPLAAAVSSRKDVFRSLPSTLHCDAISLRQEPC